MRYYAIEDLEIKRPAEGVRIRVIPGKRMTMAFFEMDSGAKVPEHSHPHEQMGTVLEGSLELVIANEKRIVKKGDAYHVASDVTHSGTCMEPNTHVLEVFSPPREDLQ